MSVTIFSLVAEFFSLIDNKYLHMNKVDFGLEYSLQLDFPLACYFSLVLYSDIFFHGEFIKSNTFGLMCLYLVLTC